MDPHSRAPKKNKSHGNEVLPQDTMHLIQKPCYQQGSLCQDPAGDWMTRRPPDHRKETQTAVVWSCLVFWPKPSCKAQWKGEEDTADRRRGGKTTSGNGQAWSSPSGEQGKWRKLVAKSSVVPQRPSRLSLDSWLVFWAQSTTRNYIRAEGDFHKERYI